MREREREGVQRDYKTHIRVKFENYWLIIIVCVTRWVGLCVCVRPELVRNLSFRILFYSILIYYNKNGICSLAHVT